MRAAITGGLGFLGFNLAYYLNKKGHDVVIFDNMSRRGSEHNLSFIKKWYSTPNNPKVGFIQCEIEDMPHKLRDFKFDVIYHFAAQVAVTNSYESPSSDFRINALGTFNILRSTNTPLIYSSTNKVYGDNVNGIPIKEKETRYEFKGKYKKGIPETFSIDSKKHTPYGCSKLTGDIYTREYGGVVNRLSCLYGPHQFGNTDQGWVSHFIISKLKNKIVTIFGNGKQVRDILYSDDVVRLLELEALNIDNIRGEVFNIGGGYENTISLLELCKQLEINPDIGDWRPADQKVYYSDISKAKNILKWSPKISPEEGIQRLIEWWKSYPEMLKSVL